jgi:eukaryotic-like serine/threonine-protein kinase
MRVVGRYALYAEIAAGGMATVHFGRLLGPVGFSRTVAIKRLHPQFAKDPEFVSMFLDEARLAARIRHPNVVPTLDVVATSGELFLVMDYVQGESLSRLLRAMRDQSTRIPPRIVSTIMSGALHGLHAAHEARDERGEPLGIVHRDISPQNVLVGTDGVARVLDFGVAKAAGRIQTTREGQLKGKLSYMAPEQLNGLVTRKTDIYAAAIVLWEALTSLRLFAGDNEAVILGKVLAGEVEPPSKYMADSSGTFDPLKTGENEGPLSPRRLELLDGVVLRGLERDPAKRYDTAREMAIALERALGMATPSDVGEWVEATAREVLHRRAEKMAEIESTSTVSTLSHAQLKSQLQTDPPPVNPSDMNARAPMYGNTPPGGPFSGGTPPGYDIPAGVASSPSRVNAYDSSYDNSSSQLSSISMSKPGEMSPQWASHRSLAMLAAAIGVSVALLLVGVTVLVVKVREKTDPTAGSPATDDTANGIPPSTASPPVPASAGETTGATNDDPTLTKDAAAPLAADQTDVTTPPPPKTSTGPWRSGNSGGPSTHTPSTTTAKKNCDPPYTVDTAGRKHYKVECL